MDGFLLHPSSGTGSVDYSIRGPEDLPPTPSNPQIWPNEVISERRAGVYHFETILDDCNKRFGRTIFGHRARGQSRKKTHDVVLGRSALDISILWVLGRHRSRQALPHDHDMLFMQRLWLERDTHASDLPCNLPLPYQ